MLRWLDTLLIHDFHHTAQRLSEEQQRKEEASLANQTSIAPGESNSDQCTNQDGTSADNDPDVCMTTTESGDGLDAGDHTELGNGRQTHEMVAAQAVLPAFSDHEVSSLQEDGMNANVSDLKKPPH